MIDFTVDAPLQAKLDWARTFVRDEVLPLETLDLSLEQWVDRVR
jgi:hypothetical protein